VSVAAIVAAVLCLYWQYHSTSATTTTLTLMTIYWVDQYYQGHLEDLMLPKPKLKPVQKVLCSLKVVIVFGGT
jgi:hypothetical protein